MLSVVLNKLSYWMVLLGLAGVFLVTPVSAQFDPLAQACDKAGEQNSAICEETNDPSNDPILGDGVLSQAVNILSFVAAIIAVIILVIGGIRMITSSGDSNAVSTARNTVIYAAVGLVVIVMARTIVFFIAGQFS